MRVAAILVAITLLIGAMPGAGFAASDGLDGSKAVGADTTSGVVMAAPISASASNAAAAFSLPWTPPSTSYRIKVQADGLYVLTYADLAAANLPVDTLDPRSFRMFAMGKEIPIRVLGEDDGRFDSGDQVLFYGRGVDSLFLDGILPTNKYTAASAYFLTYECAIGPCSGPYGLRMTEPDGSGQGSTPGPYVRRVRMGRDFWYFSNYPFLFDADHWYSDWVTPSVARTYSFSAYNLPAASPDASLTLDLLGWSNYAHILQVWVNNRPVITTSSGWSGFATYTPTVTVPSSYLIEGANLVKVGTLLPAGAPADTIYVNWIDISYYDSHAAENGELAFRNDSAGAWRYDITNFATPSVEVYDVSDWLTPQRVISTTLSGSAPTYTVSFGDTVTTTKRYLAVEQSAWKKPAAIERVALPVSYYQPHDLLALSNRADYILITHQDFWTQAEQLAAYRSASFRVALVDVQQIYDQFNGGMMSAESIHDFLAYAYANWRQPVPAYVLLMGDGTNDMRNNRTSARTFVPPYMYLADPDLGETAADNRFVTLSGDDNIPEMHIGRFPVNTRAEAQAMVDKAIHYEQGCNCDGVWNKNTLFVTDDLEGGGGDFYAYSDKVADGYAVDLGSPVKFVPSDYTVTKAYLGLTCDTVGNPADAAQCRKEITSTLNITGTLFVSYVGHATKEYWAVEHLFDKAAVSSLTNGPCLPIMLAMTCYEGSFFDYSTPEVLAEASVRKPVSGAVASWSPTGFGLVSGHDYLEQGLLLAWFNQGISRLGAAITYAKQYLVDHAPPNRYLDLLDTFVLLGDPALEVKTEAACLTPTGVLMSSFEARQETGPGGAVVLLSWQTADESDIVGFNVLRRQGVSSAGTMSSAGTDGYTVVNDQLILANHAGISQAGSYSYRDGSAQLGLSYEYKLQIVKRDGSTEAFGHAVSRLSGVRVFLPFAGY